MPDVLPPEAIPEPFIRALLQSRVALFLGAGCSAEPPAEIPPAPKLAEKLELSTGITASSLEEIAAILWEQGGWQEFAKALPRDEWRARSPNLSHRVIAELCKEGLVREVITTNWDILVEGALQQARQPYSVIVRAQSLDTEPVGSTLVIKVHGCIDHPESIKARAEDIDSSEWRAGWVSALFETVLRTRALLFAGYSGASGAASASVAALVTAQARTGFDIVVDRSPIGDMEAKPQGRVFLDALRLNPEAYVQAEADQFFEALRAAVFPQLLRSPRADGASLIAELCGPTQIADGELLSRLDEVATHWKESGRDEVQRWLADCFFGTPDVRAPVPYIAIRQHSGEIGRCWAWIALAIWSGVGSMPSPDAAAVRLSDGSESIEVLIVSSEPNKRRDTLAREITANRQSPKRLEESFVGVMFDGIGPLEPVAQPFSVVRGVAGPSVARGGAVAVRWFDGSAAFATLLPNMTVEAAQQALKDKLLEMLAA